MKIELWCSCCNKEYICSYSNTKIRGTIITSTCPTCKYRVARNFSAFLEEQTHDDTKIGIPGLEQARQMIFLGQHISNEVNDDLSNAVKRKKKKQ